MSLNRTIRGTAHPIFTAGMAAILGLLNVSLAAAQTGSNAEQSPQLDTITVTGSRIQGADVVGSQPVVRISSQQIEASGIKSIGQLLYDMPSIGFSTGVAQGGYEGSGSSRISLHYLGNNRLLVLLNGKRMVTSLSGSVDLTQIPISIVDHIEILQGGASAVYGSDAIAGVVNIVTRKDFNGAELSAYYGASNGSGNWDGQTQHYAFNLGLSNDKGHMTVSAQYRHANPIPTPSRQFAVPDPRLGTSRGSTTTPQGRFLFFAPSGGDPTQPGNPPAAYTGLTLEQCPNRTYITDSGETVYLPYCDLTIIEGTDGQSPSDYKRFTAEDRAPETTLPIPITMDQGTWSVYTEGSYDVSPSVSAHASGLYTRRESVGDMSAALIHFNLPGDTIAAGNPYNPFGFTLSTTEPIELAPGVSLPALTAIHRRTVEVGLRTRYHDSTTFRFTGGLSGDFSFGDSDWNWNADYIYSTNNLIFHQINNDSDWRIALAMSPRCSDTVGCVPLNLFGGQGVDGNGTITEEMSDWYAWNPIYQRDEKTFRGMQGNLSSGNLFELPAGPLGIAVGYEYRDTSGIARPDPFLEFPHLNNIPPSETLEGSVDVTSFYGELRIPILRDRPGAELLTLDLASRYSDYSTFGDTTNSRVGLRYQPIENLVIRGAYSEGFRAANISALYQPTQPYFPYIDDPCNNYAHPGTPAEIQENCEAAGVPPGYVQTGTQYQGSTGGNPNLDPETSISETFGLIYRPGWIDGLEFTLNYYNIELEDTITTISTQRIFDFCYRQGVQQFCDAISRGPSGAITGVDRRETNLGGTNTAGFDVGLSYLFPETSFGTFEVSLRGNRVNYFEEYTPRPDGTVNTVDVVGNLDNGSIPEWKGITRVDYEYGAWSVSLIQHYLSDFTGRCSDSYDDTEISLTNLGMCSDPNPENNGESRNHTGSTIWYDLRMGYLSPWDVMFTLGARNVFGKEPPPGRDGHGYIPSLHHALYSRFVYGRVSYSF